MNFETALKEGKLVVVAGSGISKAPPSNLPSWWDYNYLLLESMGRLGAEYIGEKNSIIDPNKILNQLPVVSISEFIVNRIAGDSYYPLLSLLDGAAPNINHYMLADLASNKSIRAIITTNFDTLLEQAFEQKKVPIIRYDSPNDYYNNNSENFFPIYKIHGSADNTDFAIDTVHQKLKGLSIEKTESMKTLFSECHILFMGFSGEDYLFGSDYIPIQVNTEGVTWLAHPGSHFNDYTKKILDNLNVCIIETTLPDFYKKHNWPLTNINIQSSVPTESFREKANRQIENFFEQPNIGKAACLGMCINILDQLGDTEHADHLFSLTDSYFPENKEINMIEGLGLISLFSALASHALLKGYYQKAHKYCTTQLKIMESQDSFSKKSGDSPEKFRERSLNKSTVMNRIGQIALYEEQYSDAMNCFKSALYMAYQAMNWENIASALFNIGTIIFLLQKDNFEKSSTTTPPYILFFESAKRIAKHGGCAQILFETNCKLVKYYSLFGQKKLMEESFESAIQLQKICINSKNKHLLLQAQHYKELFQEGPAWPLDHFPLYEPYDHENIWYPFGQRPVLSCEEGKKAKNLYEGGQFMDCLNHLSEAINQNIEQHHFEVADMLLDSSIGILLDLSNKAGLQQDKDTQLNCLRNAKDCLDTSMLLTS